MTLRIDADSHFFPRREFGSLAELLPGFSARAADMILRDALVFSDPDARRVGFRAKAEAKKQTEAREPSGQQGAARGTGSFRESGLSDVEVRAQLLPQTGFDMQVLIPHGIFGNPFGSPVGRAMDQGIRLAICKAYNNAAAAAQRQFPDRLIGTAVVPFGDVSESSTEATRAVKQLGLRAVTISGNWMGKNYDSIELYPFWETMNALDVPLYVHHNPFACQIHDHLPSTYTLGWERLRRLHISNYLGFGFEYMMALARLTLGGELKEFPK
ncbi:MAG: amidohydrolase family protein, partial [Candidatus Binatia bacterium]